MAEVVVRKLNKKFDTTHVVKDVDLQIHDKEFVVFVGPSGCGKTTTLRMIAGLEAITSGEILIDDTVVNDVPPMDRDIAMVFQNYALYPHMSVAQNMAYALKIGGVDRATIDKRVANAARILELEPLLARKPRELSGGMQQRLSIAQALIAHPRVLLLDEPFGALDPGVRKDMHGLILELWREHGLTILMVTHDIKEAFKLGTRVIAIDKRRHDPHAPNRYGSTAVYDFPVEKTRAVPAELAGMTAQREAM